MERRDYLSQCRAERLSDGEYRDIAHPINSGTREQIQNLILKKYEEVLQEKEEE